MRIMEKHSRHLCHYLNPVTVSRVMSIANGFCLLSKARKSQLSFNYTPHPLLNANRRKSNLH